MKDIVTTNTLREKLYIETLMSSQMNEIVWKIYCG